MPKTVHVIGAGLAGLSAAVRLVEQGVHVVIHEATRQAGGRCRSYDDVQTGMHIDNGTHLLLSGNRAAVDYLQTIGVTPLFESSNYHFVDLASGESWTLRLGDGRIPWWIFDASRRVPGTSLGDYLALAWGMFSTKGKTLGDVIDCNSLLYKRLTEPLMLAALNIDPKIGSAELAATIARETLGRGGAACRPLVMRQGLSAAFVDPAIDFLQQRNGILHFSHELQRMDFSDARVTALNFGTETIQLAENDAVIIAVPATAAVTMVPKLQAPNEFHAIVNAHFDIAPMPNTPFMTGVVNGNVEWIFAFKDRISATISYADRFLPMPKQDIAQMIWSEIAKITGADATLPTWQLVRERRATFAATTVQNARRPATRTAWRNLALAGDWTDTGLPSTIEGAIRSGQRAAASIGYERET